MSNTRADRLLETDPWLAPFRNAIEARISYTDSVRTKIAPDGNLSGLISQGHLHFGLNLGVHNGVEGLWVREWAPGASLISLIGDFNFWNPAATLLDRDEWGTWSTFLPGDPIAHASRIKLHVITPHEGLDRIPAYIRRVVQEADSSFVGQYWAPQEAYEWKNSVPPTPQTVRIYEAHIGMAHEDGRIGSYTDFANEILPRIVALGYNTVQLMAVAEHPYYGSFGYHVSNFFAPSSRFGTPEDLKFLIDTAHGLGLSVVMDIVHSHAVKNVLEGLNRFDGTDHQYFHSGPRGEHPAWDSMVFDYGKYEVLRFLLSNVRYWVAEFRIDGYRFDGITSMLYRDHGIGRNFVSYEDYVSDNVDQDAVAYLTLANELLHEVRPGAISIAEDVSGMPGLALPVESGGIGFDYRLAMGVPDHWIKLLKEHRDEDWNLGGLFHELTNRRPQEKSIGYAESHDQAMVGDKTIAFWLMDQQMYWNMSKFANDPVIARGVALHKMIRLLTFALAGGGYLNFMGNEFGHPEWIDFPRAENNYSHHYARRQWSLVDQDHLHYSSLNAFDKAMIAIDLQYQMLNDPFIEKLAVHEDTRQLIFRRGPLVFAFNFHATESYPDLRIPIPDPVDLRVILDTDGPAFGGHGAVAADARYPWQDVPMYGRSQSAQIYLPARSAQVLAPL